MYKSLMPDLLSIRADLPTTVALAAAHGFAGVDAGAGALAAPNIDVDGIRKDMQEAKIRPGYVMMSPVRVPVPEADWQVAMADLPTVARQAQRLGFRRAALVVLPFHETLPFDDAFAEQVRRLNEMTAVLDDEGIALGLEYVSPLSRRAPYPHAFVHDMAGMLALCAALDSPNAGLLLDSFHWYCAGESAADIERLTAQQIVAVHVNDAPPVPRGEQVVGVRALPGATGVIDLLGFLRALDAIGYDGPITCEPMASAIAALPARDDADVLDLVCVSLESALRKTLS